MPRSRDQLEVLKKSAGCRASNTQPPATSTGRKPSRKTPSESRGQPHFVQPPAICESARTSPAAAITPYVAQYSPAVWVPIWVASQSRNPPTTAATSVAMPRVTPNMVASVPRVPGRSFPRRAKRNPPRMPVLEPSARTTALVRDSPWTLSLSGTVPGTRPERTVVARARCASGGRGGARRSGRSPAPRGTPRPSGAASGAKTWSTTPIRSSFQKGRSTCSRETTFTDSAPQTGHRTASPSQRSPGATATKDDGNTGRGRPSR